MLNALTDLKVEPQVIDEGADKETLTGSGVDMAGYSGGVMFIAYVQGGEAENGFVLSAEGADESDFSDATDILDPDTGVAVAVELKTTVAAAGYACLEIIKPRTRYLRPVLTVPDLVAAKAVSIIAVLTDPYHAPVDNEGLALVSPNRQ